MATHVNGAKLNTSHVVWQITKFIYQGIPDKQICQLLRERYSYKISLPSIAAFRKNFYPARIEELKASSQEFQEKQTGRIKSFIDESLTQSQAIKQDIQKCQDNLKFLDDELKYSKKLSKIFQTALDKYVSDYEPGKDPFPHSKSSKEEEILQHAINDSPQGLEIVKSYMESRSPQSILKLVAMLRAKVLDNRNSLVKIHQNIFKGYRNFSVMQELTEVFDRYNGLIIEEFFPNRRTMDKAKYFAVRKRILALFDEFQTKYQGVDSPSDKTSAPEVEARSVVEQLKKDPNMIEHKAKEQYRDPKGLKGRKLSKTKMAKLEREKELSEKNDSDDSSQDEPSEKETQEIIDNMKEDQHRRPDLDLFSNQNGPDLGQDVISSLDYKSETYNNDKNDDIDKNNNNNNNNNNDKNGNKE